MITVEQFNNFNQNEQIDLLTNASKSVLSLYGIENPNITLIQHGMNTVFSVQDMDSNNLYVLRIHPLNWLGIEDINSEMLILNYLNTESDLHVCKPVIAKDGSFVQLTKEGILPGQRCCVLFEWINSEFINQPLGNDTLFCMGKNLAKLHEYGLLFNPSFKEKLKRPKWDYDGLFSANGLYSASASADYTDNLQKEVFQMAEQSIQNSFIELRSSNEQFGFIHGDYFFRNLFIINNDIGMIDFDMCGYGFYLFDIVMPYWPKKQNDIDEAYKYFLDGYKTIRSLPYGFNEYRYVFEACRRLMEAYWVAIRSDLPHIRPHVSNVIKRTSNKIHGFYDKKLLKI